MLCVDRFPMDHDDTEATQPPAVPARPSTLSLDEQGLETMASSDGMLSACESFESVDSRTTEEKSVDEFFDNIEDLLSAFMSDASRHHLHCRFFHWSMPGDPTRMLDAVIVIHPPFQKK